MSNIDHPDRPVSTGSAPSWRTSLAYLLDGLTDLVLLTCTYLEREWNVPSEVTPPSEEG